jgi:peroxiredoxin family protein
MLQSERVLEEAKEAGKNKLVLVVSKGTIDMLYPALVLATTAPAMGMEVDMYFTFWGLKTLTRKGVRSPKLGSVGNPGLPIPNILGIIPGMTNMVSWMMKKRIGKYWPTVYDMMKMAKEAGARIHACSPTMGFMGVKEEDLIAEVDDIVGASTFLGWAADPKTITLFI